MRDYPGEQVNIIEDPKTRRILTSVDYFLRDLSKGIARIQKGEVPDGSGTPISSPPFLGETPGSVLFVGSDLSFEEDNPNFFWDDTDNWLGLGLNAPLARLHLEADLTGGSSVFLPNSTLNTGAGGDNGWSGPHSGAGGGAGTGTKWDAIAINDDNTNYLAVQAALGTNPHKAGLNGTVLPNRTYTVTVRCRTLSGTVDNQGIITFFLYDSTGNGYATANFDINGLTTTWTTFTKTVTCSGAPTASPPTFTANSFWIGAQGLQGATSLFICTTYVEVAGGGTDIIRWNTAAVQSGRVTVDGYLESQRLQLTGATSGTLTHQPAAVTTDHSLTWPGAQGAASTLLSNNGSGVLSWATLASLGFAPVGATYITQTADATLTNEQALGSLATGILKSTTTTGVLSIAVGADLPAHNFLSAQHGDTTVGTVARGDVITGQGASAKWVRLAKGTANQVLSMDGTATDVIWATVAAGGNTFLDNVFRVQDNGDATKQLAFEVSGVTTATTRTLTVPDRSSTIATLAGTQTFTGELNFPNIGTAGVPVFHSLGFAAAEQVFRMVDDADPGTELQVSVTQALTGAGAGAVSLTIPGDGGGLVTDSATQTLSAKTLSTTCILRSNTASVGVSFADNTTTTKKLRFVLSGVAALTNNSITLVSTAARNYTFGNDTGFVDLIVAPASATVDKTGQTATIAATTAYTTTHAGFYRISAYWVFTAVTLAGTLTVSVLFTDPQQAQTELVINAAAFAAAGDNASGQYVFYATTGTTIQFSTTLTNTGTYNVYVRVESLS